MAIDALDALIGTPYGATTRRRPARPGGGSTDVGALAAVLAQAIGSNPAIRSADPGILLSILGTIGENQAREEAIAREEALRQEELALQQEQLAMEQGQALSGQAVEMAMSGAPRAQVQSVLGALSGGAAPEVGTQVQSTLGALYPQAQLGPRVTGLSPSSGAIPDRQDMADIREVVSRGIRDGLGEDEIVEEAAAPYKGPSQQAARAMARYVYQQWSRDPEHFGGRTPGTSGRGGPIIDFLSRPGRASGGLPWER